MFGLSPGKLLVLAIVAAIVWYGWKYAKRVEAVRRALNEELQRRRGGGAGNLPAEDLVKCETCGAYVPGSAKACGRTDCPRPR
jgi:hypothetical protein